MHAHEAEFIATNSPEDILLVVMKHKKPVKNEDNWLVGFKQINFPALFDWVDAYKKEKGLLI